MRRSRASRNSPSVSLFPFLAVLICTMGALIVLLVLVVQQARVHATVAASRSRETQVERERQRRQRRIEREDQQWRVEILEQSREKKLQELADQRRKLSHLENHIRELEDRWNQLKQQAEELQRLNESKQQDKGALVEELSRTQADLEQARRELEKAREEAAKKPRSYALIPYDGPHGTHRRPVYVECTADGVILQPEGVVLTARDFVGPMGPGNPLDAALRTVREYQRRTGTNSGEPYPLLVVRPDGVTTYAMARAAMRSWDDEFGYEMIEDDLRLDFGRSDPQLAQQVRRSIQLARDRQKKLQAAMPRSFGGSDRFASGYVVSSARGGMVPLNAPAAGEGRGFGQGEGGTSLGKGKHGETNSPQAARDERAARPGEPTSDEGRFNPEGARGNGGNGAAPLSETRGADFALLNKSPGATGYTRPMRIDCFADRLVIQPEPASGQRPVSFPAQGSLTDSIDPFLVAVQKRIESWGLAAGGGYWKPHLFVYVAPGAEARFRELEVLLDNSGLVIKRKYQP